MDVRDIEKWLDKNYWEYIKDSDGLNEVYINIVDMLQDFQQFITNNYKDSYMSRG